MRVMTCQDMQDMRRFCSRHRKKASGHILTKPPLFPGFPTCCLCLLVDVRGIGHVLAPTFPIPLFPLLFQTPG